MKPTIITKSAKEDFRLIIQNVIEFKEELKDKLLETVEKKFNYISQSPYSGSSYKFGFRKVYTDKFHLVIFYEVKEKEILIVSLQSTYFSEERIMSRLKQIK